MGFATPAIPQKLSREAREPKAPKELEYRQSRTEQAHEMGGEHNAV